MKCATRGCMAEAVSRLGFCGPCARGEVLPQPPRNIDVAPPAMGSFSFFEHATSVLAQLMKHRERYLRAWLAATGLDPREATLVEKVEDTGRRTLRVVSNEMRCARCTYFVETDGEGPSYECVRLQDFCAGQFCPPPTFGCSRFRAR